MYSYIWREGEIIGGVWFVGLVGVNQVGFRISTWERIGEHIQLLPRFSPRYTELEGLDMGLV